MQRLALRCKRSPRPRRIVTLSEEAVLKRPFGAILPWPVTRAAGLTQAGVLPLWRRLIRPLLRRGCFNGGPADRDVPAVLSDHRARGHHRLPPWDFGPSRLS